jgi:hypothetical protein
MEDRQRVYPSKYRLIIVERSYLGVLLVPSHMFDPDY